MGFLQMVGGVYGALFAAALASFAGVVAERGRRGESPFGGRSHCACGRQLRAWENVPVLGWLLAAGRARCCGARIPARYVLSEAVAGAAGFGFGAQMGSWLLDGVPVWAIAASSVTFVMTVVGAVILVDNLLSQRPQDQSPTP